MTSYPPEGPGRRDRRRRRLPVLLAGAAVALVGIGVGLGVSAVTGGPAVQPPPLRATSAAGSSDASGGAGSSGGHRATTTAPGPASGSSTSGATAPLSATQASAPVSIAIPALDVSSQLGPSRGLNPNGTINDAPLSGPIWSLPWWYRGGPSPGETGSAVILGHVDSAIGAGQYGVFYRLGDLQAGQPVTVTLQDGTVTHWQTVSNVLYPDTTFPDSVIYNQDGAPTLRLVTCGGTFDNTTHEYEGAVVVTAELTGVSAA